MKYQLTTLVLGEVAKEMRGSIFQTKALRSAPHYFEASVPHQVIIDEHTATVAGHQVTFSLKGYPPDILLVQTTTEMRDIFMKETFDLEEAILKRSDAILTEHGGNKKFSETYSIFMVSEYKGEPEKFLKYAPLIAGLLKSERIELDAKEVEYTLSTQIKYAKHDLAIIDWDGAFLFDAEGDFRQTVELLTLANVQLLRHRIVDRKLDERLMHASEIIKRPLPKRKLFRNEELTNEMRDILRARMEIITHFQILERDIKLIGDWYPARLYELAAKKFRISEWRSSLKEKLESLEDVYGVIIENFSVSAKTRSEQMLLLAEWLVIIGWFSLVVVELLVYVK
jgi:hypothetical protein